MFTLRDVIQKEIKMDKKKSIIATLSIIIGNPSKRVILLYRISKISYDKGFCKLGILLRNRMILKYGVHISLKADIGLGLELRHINGVVIGDGVKIGKNVVIYQQVTLGGQNLGDSVKNNYPIVGDNVIIFAGAKILGDVIVGSNSIVGANSVVIKNVDEYSVYAGIPAKKIKDLKELSE
ncbi:serine O-acetyltransferase [Natranaerovirga pectinivora]|uniref:Serine acetyltransferase n=1 Tax=Natranaerovirga pectinivora TaxID=682400 RepID=A0A4V2UZW7_9FIRM|nr:serine acetyltransferase [Natranaerovirga pectinivora]TCT12852.1 serine O-acetyltransferase [Natranaerovirga pectinivora]